MSREYTPEEAKALLMKATQLKIKLIERDLQELRKKEAKKSSAAISAGGGIEGVAHAKLNPPGKDDPEGYTPLRKKPVEKGEPMEDSPHGEEETSGEKSPADVIDDAIHKSEDATKLIRLKPAGDAKTTGMPKITPQPAVAAGLARPNSPQKDIMGAPAEGLPPPGAKQRTLISNPTNPSWMKKEMGADEKCEKCGMEKAAHEMEKRCWEGYEPVPGKKPYSKGSCAPAKKAELVDAKGNTKSNSEDPSATMPDDGSKHYNEPGKDYTKSKAKLVSKEGSGGSIEKGKALDKGAMPPMAKPPSGTNMATKVPTSKPAMKQEIQAQGGEMAGPPGGTVTVKTAKPELEKGVMADIARKDSESRTGEPAGAGPEAKVKMPTPEQHSARANMFQDAMSGAYSAPTSPPKPKLAAPPKAAVAKPVASPAPAKPGIFGRLMGKK